MTPGQFGTCFRYAKPNEVERYGEDIGKLSNDQFIIVGGEERVISKEERRLALAFWTRGNKLMILRKKPIAIDTDGFCKDEEEHNRLYSQLLLFRHWQNETSFLGDSSLSEESCRSQYSEERLAIGEVTEGLRNILRRQLSD